MSEFGDQDLTTSFMNTYQSMFDLYSETQSPVVAETSAVGKTILSKPTAVFAQLDTKQIDDLVSEMNRRSPEGMRRWAKDAKDWPNNTDPRNAAVLGAYKKLKEATE